MAAAAAVSLLAPAPPGRTLRLPHELWLLPRSERGHFWRATLASALAYADAALS